MSRAHYGLTLLATPLAALLISCGGKDVRSVPPPNAGDQGGPIGSTTAQFDPTNKVIPLPNVLATATAVDPVTTAWYNPQTQAVVAGARPYGVPMQPPEALAYTALREMGGPAQNLPTGVTTNAVAGLNAPIYIQFSAAIDPATVTPSTVKVFQVLPDAPVAGNTFETSTLGFKNVSGLFNYSASAGSPNAGILASGTELQLFPRVPLTPGTRYLYVVTNGVKDTLGHGVGSSFTFSLLRYSRPSLNATNAATDTTNLTDFSDPTNPATIAGASGAAQLEQLAGNATAGPNVVFSGYRKTMWDLVTNASADTTGRGGDATGITKRTDISLIGRFITTGAVAIRTTQNDPTTLKPTDLLLRAFAAGNFPTKTWNNTVSVDAVFTGNTGPTALSVFYTQLGLPASAYTNIGTVVVGHFHSADLQIDPSLAPTSLPALPSDQSTLAGGGAVTQGPSNAFCYTTGILAPAFSGGNLAGFYNTDRIVPFLAFLPSAGSGGLKTVIFQHGITSQKEAAAAVANTIALSGRATVSIDLPMHGALAANGLTGNSSDPITVNGVATTKGALWGQYFMSLTSLLTGRTNVQQAALNLHRLDILMRTGAFAGAFAGASVASYPATGATQQNYTFVGQSLGSIVGTYYMVGTTTIGSPIPYTSATLQSDMKGFLSVPGSTLGYLLKDSVAFGPTVNAALAANGVVAGTPTYNQFFQTAQTLVDPVDPASCTLPLAAGLPSRLAFRTAMQEAMGDQVIPNYTTRYLGNALGGRTLFGGDFAPGFQQLMLQNATSPLLPFMLGATPTTIKAQSAATNPGATTPTEGYYQFGPTGFDHGFLLDNTTPANTAAAQKQLLFFLGGPGAAGASIVVDPGSF